MDVIRGHILELSVQMYGTRVVQKASCTTRTTSDVRLTFPAQALEHVVPDVQRAIMRELEGSVLTCAKDQNANHVLQRSLERLDPPSNAFITDAFVGEAFDLATNSFGCRVLQRAFENLPERQIRPLLNELHGLAQQVFLDGYGNYIAQWVITEGPKADSTLMISKIKGQIFGLSKHKFAVSPRSHIDDDRGHQPDGTCRATWSKRPS